MPRAQRASPVPPDVRSAGVHRLHQTNAPRRRADDPVALMRLILRRVWQRTFVVLDPHQIPRIDPAVARHASEKMFGFTNATPVGANAEQRPARSRLIE